MIAPRPWLADLPAYRPGLRAPSEAGSLASNETSSTSPLAADAVARARDTLHRYPAALADALRERLAAMHGVSVGSVLVGGGSDELLFLLAVAYAAGGAVACADPGYWGYRHAGTVVGATVHAVPCVDDRHDLAAMAREPVDLAFICNPHNPTGTIVDRPSLERFAGATAARLTVVDEAYIEFADRPDELTTIPLAAEGSLVTLRTMSKYYGLAGLRVGYLVGPASVVDVLSRIRAPFSVNAVGQDAAMAALDDVEHQRRVRDRTVANRRAVTALFEGAGFEVVASQANFVLVRTDHEAALLEGLAVGGVRARPGADLGIPGSVRLTVPDDEGLALVARTISALDGGAVPPERRR